MDAKAVFDQVSAKTSRITTLSYSTSFSLGIKVFNQRFREPIYNIYGFVRFADEIVDSFHAYNKKELFDRFRKDTWLSIDEGISLNPILNSFQKTVNQYGIESELIESFLNSMEMDLFHESYDRKGFNDYVLGSAEVVGLMCLRVFCEGDDEKYQQLKGSAMKLGAAYQKINFLRDLRKDYKELGRNYFPGLDISRFNEEGKKAIEMEIEEDFRMGYEGITGLPKSVRFGVYLSYVYYYSLFNKIRNTSADKIMEKRIRIDNSKKYMLLLSSALWYKMSN
ncbi:MAG TPA: squalene/phytoene synthase family protein [Bacteroidales bacterium]|nr:squalene/phytoene synthase family protein [Bacteroidales bacterium]